MVDFLEEDKTLAQMLRYVNREVGDILIMGDGMVWGRK